jgi:hypothetical protein
MVTITLLPKVLIAFRQMATVWCRTDICTLPVSFEVIHTSSFCGPMTMLDEAPSPVDASAVRLTLSGPPGMVAYIDCPPTLFVQVVQRTEFRGRHNFEAAEPNQRSMRL